MALEFLRDRARYNPYSDVVTFFAKDGEASVMFNITHEALEYLDAASLLTDQQLLAAFMRHLDRILHVAADLYAAGSRREHPVEYAITKTHFGGHPTNR